MQFNSLIFLFFFLPVFLLIFYTLRQEFRNSWLILSSLFFYTWGQREAVFILLILIFVNYILGVKISGTEGKKISRAIYISAIVFNVLVLIFYKYLTFLLSIFGIDFQIRGLPFPRGISFLTFLAISYLTDVYRKTITVTKGISSYALYITLFPKLITGPITLYSDFAGQLRKREIDSDDISVGIKRFITGLGKKVLIADTLAKTANIVFTIPPDKLGFVQSWIGILAYTLQIYYDFSGYSDMAIGLGRMMGFHIPENFNYPYISESVKDFWNRWHITLGAWLRTYLFLPIAYWVMRRIKRERILRIKVENWAYYTGILVTFIICGIWHGAAWTFVLWGLYYGLVLAVEHMGMRKYMKRRFHRTVRIFITQLFVITGWVIFRSGDINYAVGYLGNMFGLAGGSGGIIGPEFFINREFILVISIALLGSFPLSGIVKRHLESLPPIKRFYRVGESIIRISIFILSIVAILAGTYQPFIYFRF